MIHSKLIDSRTLLRLFAAALALLASAGVAPALAEGTHEAPRWDILTRSAPTNLAPGQKGEVVAVIVNLGDAPVVSTQADPVEITDALPAGLVATGVMEGYAARGDNDRGELAKEPLKNCEALPELRCPYLGTLPPYIAIEVHIPVQAETSLQEGEQIENEVRVEGANAPPKIVRRPLILSAEKTPFGVERYELSPEEEDGSPDIFAGSHPFQLTSTIELNQGFGIDPTTAPKETPPRDFPSAPALLRNLNTTLPPGLVADTKATALPQCSAVDFASLRVGNSNECPPETAIGAAVVTFKEPHFFQQLTATVPVFNLVPEEGEPARFGFVFEKVPVVLDTSLQTGKGYAVEVKVENSSQAAELVSSIVTVWGVPGAPQHDNARGWECLGGGDYVEGLEPRPACPAAPSKAPPYLILPTTLCAQPLLTSVAAQSWRPGAELLSPQAAKESESLQGCERLPFEPSIRAQPEQHEASTPTGLNVEVTVPQNTTLAANGVAEADIKDTTLTLPEGMQANPGAAGGLAVCSALGEDGMGFEPGPGFTEETQLENDRFEAHAVSCPPASKIGTVDIRTPLLEDELEGSVYLAEQNTNPFRSPLALYLVAEDRKSGVRVKLAGEVSINPATGQLTSAFRNTPPLPFETLKLELFDGERASQATPSFCRSYETLASFTPTSGEQSVQRSSSFATEPNRDGQPCPASGPLPFAPSFQAGATNNQAAAFTPFTLTIDRPDGDQALDGIEMNLPPGIAAKLSSVTACQEPPVAQEWACSEASLLGEATSSSGLGTDPVTLKGHVYLTSGYDGAPFGLLVSTLAQAGPFDLGIVNVRSRIDVNPDTAAVTIASDPGPRDEALPRILDGVPVQLKQINVTVDRPEFEFNPTNCSPMAITGTLAGSEAGTDVAVSYPFEAANCASLPFTPELTASVRGQGSKVDGTTFAVKIKSPGLGQANIHKVDLTIPAVLPSRLRYHPESLSGSGLRRQSRRL